MNRKIFSELIKNKFNTSCYVKEGKITDFADPKVEQMYSGFVLGYNYCKEEKPKPFWHKWIKYFYECINLRR